MPREWKAGAEPWLRRHQPEIAYNMEPKPVQCMFCGEQTLKRSMSDRPKETGRLELYCDNEFCDVREMTLLVMRDGTGAHERADVRALRLIDSGELDVYTAVPPKVRSDDVFDLLADRGAEVERRMRKAPVLEGGD